MSELRRRIGGEHGIVLPVTISMLALAMVVTVTLLGIATRTSSGSSRNNQSKRASAAAEAGVQVARWRLAKVQPAAGMCLTDREVAPGTAPAAAGECPAATGSAGENSTYAYYVTPGLAAGATCAGSTVGVGDPKLPQRCVTSYGTAAGQTRRVQVLVQSKVGGNARYPVTGIFAGSAIDINENGFGDVTGPVGTNGTFKLKSCKTGAGVTTWDPGPGATITNSCSGSPSVVSPARTTTWPPLGSLGYWFDNPNTALAGNNDNATLAQAGFSYTAATRSWQDSADATLTLNGANPRAGSGGLWLFNLCSFKFTHVTSIRLTNGARARFLVDSSERSGSGCSGTGTLTMTNVSYINYDTSVTPATPGDPTALEFMFIGTGTVAFSNQSGFSAMLTAPNTEVKFTNKTKWKGSIAAEEVTATNGLDFTAGSATGLLDGTAPGGISRASWGECRSAATIAADPESGC